MGESKSTLDLEAEVEKAKKFLKAETSESGNGSLFDHLTDVLSKLLNERPSNSVDVIENFMRRSRDEKKKVDAEDTTDILNILDIEEEASLFRGDADGEGIEIPPENEEEFETPLPNVMELSFFFEQAGVGLGREEMYKIFLALKQLVYSYPLVSTRFWGKVLGLESNYYVAEVELREGEEGDEEEEGKSRLRKRRRKRGSRKIKNKQKDKVEEKKFEYKEETIAQDEEDGDKRQDEKDDETSEDGGPMEEDNIPKSQWKPAPTIPKEDHHIGANKKVYFVCQEPGKPWVRLPHVTPAQIVAARGIRKFFRGKLDAPIISYPPFPGNEANYLRAQIARISASTHISPAGFYVFEEEEEEEEGEIRESFVPNVEFEGLSLRELTDAEMQNWVHHVQHILPQGRCNWFNPFEKPEEDFEDEELDEEEETEEENIRPEIGPTLLSPVSDDEVLSNGIPAWTAHVSSRALPEYGIAVVRSNRWPGSYVFAKEKKFENIYIGYGHKYFATNYSPPAPPTPFEEYNAGPEVSEMTDPSVEEERAVKQAQEEAMKEEDDIEGADDDEDDDD